MRPRLPAQLAILSLGSEVTSNQAYAPRLGHGAKSAAGSYMWINPLVSLTNSQSSKLDTLSTDGEDRDEIRLPTP